MDVQATAVGLQGPAQPLFAPQGEGTAPGGHVHLVGVGLPYDGAHFVDGVARADDESATPPAQPLVEVGEAVREEREAVRRGETGLVHRRVADEERDGLVARAQCGTQRRMVVDPQVRGEQDDRDVHDFAPGVGPPAAASAVRAMLRAMPPKTRAWKGETLHQ